MTLYELRKSIVVTVFENSSDLAKVSYIINGQQKQINLYHDEFKEELTAIGSIDEEITDEEFKKYHISQWDALNIAIRHEYRNYLEADNEKTDIFSALANIINPHK